LEWTRKPNTNGNWDNGGLGTNDEKGFGNWNIVGNGNTKRRRRSKEVTIQ
jgi:hypothetical protein